MKQCTRCEQTLPIDAFSKGQGRCKSCRAALYRERYQADLDGSRSAQRERSRRWYARNASLHRERVYDWRRRNRTAYLNRRQQRRQLEVGQRGSVQNSDIEALFRRWGNRCAYCGEPAGEIDHVVPISRGGAHTLGNLLPACRSCNARKQARLLVEWRTEHADDGSIRLRRLALC